MIIHSKNFKAFVIFYIIYNVLLLNWNIIFFNIYWLILQLIKGWYHIQSVEYTLQNKLQIKRLVQLHELPKKTYYTIIEFYIRKFLIILNFITVFIAEKY